MLEQQTFTESESRQLVERVAGSRYFAKSARLRDLLLFLAEHALRGAGEIHEQEVGHKVFGRPPDYDTSSDNIVRVHASTLRKRLEQYFAEDGASETILVEIPKGKYSPLFRKREALAPQAPDPEPPKARKDKRDWRVAVLALTTCAFALTTGLLLVRQRPQPEANSFGPTVRAFWSQIFHAGQTTDIVLDDAGVGLYQELTGRSFTLSDYFDRSYLRTVSNASAPAKLDENWASAMVLRRQSSVASVGFLWRLFQFAGPQSHQAAVVFARDYSFRGLKSDNAVLLGTVRSNPWMEPFLQRVGVRWMFDKNSGTYYPVDTWAQGEAKAFRNSDPAENRESYSGISLLPNIGGDGNVLLLSATGGSAVNVAASFLADEDAMASLRRMLGSGNGFPHFEALLKVKGRSTQPRDVVIVICRPARSRG